MLVVNYSKSAILLERAKKVLAGGVSSEFRKYNHPHAIFYTHGKGSQLYDVDGRNVMVSPGNMVFLFNLSSKEFSR